MTDKGPQKITLDFGKKAMGQCCTVYDPDGVQTGAIISDNDLPRRLPAFDFADRDWRDACMLEKARIPAGYTYLGQLIGHDAGESRKANQIPHVQNSFSKDDKNDAQAEFDDQDEEEEDKLVQTGANARPNGRYNIIENPLTFETLYGSGPITLHHVFDPITMLFRVSSNSAFSVDLSKEGHKHIYALYDVRNRDNLMVHQLAVTWMKYHNFVALAFRHDLRDRADKEDGLAMDVFVKARKHVLATWHRVIREDFVNAMIHPDVAAMSETEMKTFDPVDETTLQHGIFRTFHCMPRADYRMKGKGPKILQELLASNLPKRSAGEHEGWTTDLDELFDPTNGKGDKTGISASLAWALKGLIRQDFATAKDVGPLRLSSEKMQAIIDSLPNPSWRDQLTRHALSEAFNAVITVHNFEPLSPQAFREMPLYVALMIEAQLHGGLGQLGPLGSVLLRRALCDRIDAVEYGQNDLPDDGPAHLNSMIEIVRTLKGTPHV
ncbi:peroxidase family protein [Sulfitobacter sp.]|uniref:peroxidase family protein n=1 Tax=Sulfitobacter sp. TaxID=1903071 RepID=UPI0030038789